MNWDRMAGNWPESKNTVRKRWNKLTDDDLRRINGKRDLLASVLVERYGFAKETADQQIKEFERSADAEFASQSTPKGSFKPGQKPAGWSKPGTEEEEEGTAHRTGA